MFLLQSLCDRMVTVDMLEIFRHLNGVKGGIEFVEMLGLNLRIP